MIVPELNTLPLTTAVLVAVGSRNAIPVAPVIIPVLTTEALLPSRTPERPAPLIVPALVTVVVMLDC